MYADSEPNQACKTHKKVMTRIIMDENKILPTQETTGINCRERIGKNEEKNHKLTSEDLWNAIVSYEGMVFYTAKGLEYSYTIRGKEMTVSRKKKTVTKASILMAYEKVLEIESVTGPKQLGVYGASYIYPIFLKLGII